MYFDDGEGLADFPAETAIVRDGAAVEEEHAPRRSPTRAGRASLALAVSGVALLAIGLDLSYYFLGRGDPEASSGPVCAGCLLVASGLILIAALSLGLRAWFALRDRGAGPWTGSALSFLALLALAVLMALAVLR